jgi:hypothetical protein
METIEDNLRESYDEQQRQDRRDNKVTYKGKPYTIIGRREDGTVMLEGLDQYIVGPIHPEEFKPRSYVQQELSSIAVRDLWEHGGAAWRTDRDEWWTIPPGSESHTWSLDNTLTVESQITSTLLRVQPGITNTSIMSVEKWARRSLATPVQVWDKHPWLLAARNGVIDLETGELIPGNPELYLTRATPHAYDPQLTDADCPRWFKHLDMLFAGDADVIHTFHKQLGAALIGDAANIKPQVYLFMQGPSGGGKGAALRMLAVVLGPLRRTSRAWTSLRNRTTGTISG